MAGTPSSPRTRREALDQLGERAAAEGVGKQQARTAASGG